MILHSCRQDFTPHPQSAVSTRPQDPLLIIDAVQKWNLEKFEPPGGSDIRACLQRLAGSHGGDLGGNGHKALGSATRRTRVDVTAFVPTQTDSQNAHCLAAWLTEPLRLAAQGGVFLRARHLAIFRSAGTVIHGIIANS
jgi:hypothetical protein